MEKKHHLLYTTSRMSVCDLSLFNPKSEPKSALQRKALDSCGIGGVARPRRHEEARRPPRWKASACSGKERTHPTASS
ncbi:hypothetical protein ABER02_12355 [Rossellomorea marisflavi]|uniref:hypothetical protein n=1 Tax=Rossellomorea marisflavi TaxID=189381 RepID=UPI003D2B09A5